MVPERSEGFLAERLGPIRRPGRIESGTFTDTWRAIMKPWMIRSTMKRKTTNFLHHFRQNRDLYLGLFLSLVAFGVYVSALSPVIQSRDNPDVITAAATLGIPHPPGYPLYTMLGFLFSKLPIGTIPFRVNLMSALFSAAAVFVIYLIILKLTKKPHFAKASWGKPLPALIGASVLAFSYNYFSQSLYADFLTLNNLLVALEILVILKWREIVKKSPRLAPKYLYLLAFIFGLAYSHHQISFLLLPAFLYLIWVTYKKSLLGWEGLKLLGFFLLGFLPYLYLPIRSAQNPLYAWGQATSINGFLEMITRKDYTAESFSQIASFPGRIKDWLLSLSWLQFTLGGFILGLYGLILFRKQDKKLFIFLLLTVLLGGMVFATFSNSSTVWLELALTQRFYIFSIMLFSIWIGLGAAALAPPFGKLTPILLIFPLLLLIFHYPLVNRRNYYYAFDLGENILKSLPDKTVLFAGFDVPVFELQYFQIIEKKRPDVKIYPGADQELFRLPDWLKMRLEKDEDYRLSIEELAQKYPVYTTMNTENFWGPRAKNFVPEGIVYRFSPEKNWLESFDGKRAQENFEKYELRDEYNTETVKNAFTEEIIYYYSLAWTNVGLAFQQKQMPEEAAKNYEKALAVAPDNSIAHLNFAATFIDRKMYAEARTEYLKILQKFPNLETAQKGLLFTEEYLRQSP